MYFVFMLLGRKILLGSEEKPLMVLERYGLDSFDFNLDSAKAELSDFICDSGESFSWGYFPGMEEDEKEKYPECIKLGKQVKDLLFDSDWELAFVKFASKKPVSPFGGFHVDVDVGVGVKRTDEREIIRAIVNLHNHPRIFLYSFADRDQLRKAGLKIPLNKYKRIYLPKRFVRKVEIPPMQKDGIYVLKFWSSIIPHFGFTDEGGFFLAGFGRYADESDSL